MLEYHVAASSKILRKQCKVNRTEVLRPREPIKAPIREAQATHRITVFSISIAQVLKSSISG